MTTTTITTRLCRMVLALFAVMVGTAMLPHVNAELTAAAEVSTPTKLTMANFRDQTQSHPLSYVLFYTKRGREWEETLAVFTSGCELMLAEYPGMLCGTVDLDDNTPLTLYTKYNSLDLMVFYPDFVPTPLRFHGKFTPEGMLKSADFYGRYTTDYMLTWANPKDLVDQFMQDFKRAGNNGESLNMTAVVHEAAFHAKKMAVYVEYLELLKQDLAHLVEVSNTLRYSLHNSKDLEKRNATSGAYDNEAAFLDQKMRLAIADDFLQHMFPKKSMPRLSLKPSKFLQEQEADRKLQAVLDAAAKVAQAQESGGELM